MPFAPGGGELRHGGEASSVGAALKGGGDLGLPRGGRGARRGVGGLGAMAGPSGRGAGRGAGPAPKFRHALSLPVAAPVRPLAAPLPPFPPPAPLSPPPKLPPPPSIRSGRLLSPPPLGAAVPRPCAPPPDPPPPARARFAPGPVPTRAPPSWARADGAAAAAGGGGARSWSTRGRAGQSSSGRRSGCRG